MTIDTKNKLTISLVDAPNVPERERASICYICTLSPAYGINMIWIRESTRFGIMAGTVPNVEQSLMWMEISLHSHVTSSQNSKSDQS